MSGFVKGYKRAAAPAATAPVAEIEKNSDTGSVASTQPAAVLKISAPGEKKMTRITGLFTTKNGNGYSASVKQDVTIPAGSRIYLFVNDEESEGK